MLSSQCLCSWLHTHVACRVTPLKLPRCACSGRDANVRPGASRTDAGAADPRAPPRPHPRAGRTRAGVDSRRRRPLAQSDTRDRALALATAPAAAPAPTSAASHVSAA